MIYYIEQLWSFVIALSLGATIPVGGLLLVLRQFSGKVSAKVEYRLLSFALFLFICPVHQILGSVFYKLQLIPDSAVPVIFPDLQHYPNYEDTITVTAFDLAHPETEIPWSMIGCSIWFVVFCFLVLFSAFSWLSFYKKIKGSQQESTEKQEDLFQNCKFNQGITTNIHLKQSEVITSPMVIGLLNPVVILPTKAVEEAFLPSIFTHELVHYARHDVWRKSLMWFVTLIHWFNPLVHYLGKELERSMEFSCDERVLELLGSGERKNYSYAILNYTQKTPIFCGLGLNSEKNTKKFLKERLGFMLSDTPKTPRILPLLVCCSLILGLSVPTLAYYENRIKEQASEFLVYLDEISEDNDRDSYPPSPSKNIGVRPWNGTEPLELGLDALSVYENEELFPNVDQYIDESIEVVGERHAPVYYLSSLSLEDEVLFPPESWEIVLERAKNDEILLFDTNEAQQAYWDSQE